MSQTNKIIGLIIAQINLNKCKEGRCHVVETYIIRILLFGWEGRNENIPTNARQMISLSRKVHPMKQRRRLITKIMFW